MKAYKSFQLKVNEKFIEIRQVALIVHIREVMNRTI